jgi:hypothetical protein
MSGDFGRRRPPEPRSRAAPGEAPTRAHAHEAGPALRPALAAGVAAAEPLRWLRGVLFGVGLLAMFAGGYVLVMKGFGRALDQHWREQVGYPGLEDAYKRTGGADASLEAVHNDCKSRSDFVRLDRKQQRALGPFTDIHVGEASLAKAAFYVSCLAGEKPERFCRAPHRAHLVAALKDYFRLLGRVREERMMAMSAPFAAERMALIGTPGRDPSTPPPSAETDPRIVAALRTLIAAGYLRRRDLAPVLGPPGDLELALRGVEAKRDGCG